MAPDLKNVTPEDPWDTGELGRDEASAVCVPAEEEQAIDDALELKMISIRLHNELLVQLKIIADHHRVGYQPLIRDILGRWARNEMIEIVRQIKAEQEVTAALEANKRRA
jgi:hypothetical protein